MTDQSDDFMKLMNDLKARTKDLVKDLTSTLESRVEGFKSTEEEIPFSCTRNDWLESILMPFGKNFGDPLLSLSIEQIDDVFDDFEDHVNHFPGLEEILTFIKERRLDDVELKDEE